MAGSGTVFRTQEFWAAPLPQDGGEHTELNVDMQALGIVHLPSHNESKFAFVFERHIVRGVVVRGSCADYRWILRASCSQRFHRHRHIYWQTTRVPPVC